jgi:hypothetical protein
MCSRLLRLPLKEPVADSGAIQTAPGWDQRQVGRRTVPARPGPLLWHNADRSGVVRCSLHYPITLNCKDSGETLLINGQVLNARCPQPISNGVHLVTLDY